MIIAVVDSGITPTHEDLKDNLWHNPDEDWVWGSPGNNGLDDDNDGYIDNYYGADALNNNGDVTDLGGHGTLVSGVAGARGNNGVGMTGVSWNSKIMACVCSEFGYATVGSIVGAIEFAIGEGADVINASWTTSLNIAALNDAFAAADAANILIVAAAGNGGNNNDANPRYPSGLVSRNVLTVAGTDKNDQFEFTSNYGKRSVDVAAPGSAVLTTEMYGGYITATGTSEAAPHVAGIAALIKSAHPTLTNLQIKARIINYVDKKVTLTEKVITGGRVNAYAAVTGEDKPCIFYLSAYRGYAGNTTLTLNGVNFGATRETGVVSFGGGVNASVYYSWSNTQIICLIPSGATSGEVTVTNAAGVSNSHYVEIINPCSKGLGIDASGNVYTVDPVNNEVRKYSPQGSLLTSWGASGTANGQFDAPESIALDSAGNVYILDTGNNRIQVLSPTGAFLRKAGSAGGGNGQFSSPEGIAVDKYNNVFVSDTGNNRIQKFSSALLFITLWGSAGSGNGQFNSPGSISADHSGNIFIADTGNNRFQKFDSLGGFIRVIGASGTGNGQLDAPSGIFAAPGGNIFVTEKNNHRVQIFSPKE